MALIKSMSARVENEQTRKLQELGANNATSTSRNEFMSFSGPSMTSGFEASNGNGDTDFEALVRGEQQGGALGGTDMLGGNAWSNAIPPTSTPTTLPSRPLTNLTRSNNASPAATFSWSTPPVSPPPNTNLSAPPAQIQTITPENTLSSLNSSFPALSASNPGIGSSLYNSTQPSSRPAMSMNSGMTSSATPSYNAPNSSSSIDWTKVGGSSTRPTTWGNATSPLNTTSGLSNPSSITPSNPYSSFSIAPPPLKPAGNNSFSIAPPPSANRTPNTSNGMGMKSMVSLRAQTQTQQQQKQQQQPNWGSGGDSLI